MLKKVYLITCFLIAAISSALFHEIGVFFGGSNYIGDVGSDRYLDPNQIAYGLLYKWNVTDRYSFRGGFTLTKLKENELNNRVIIAPEDHMKLKTQFKNLQLVLKSTLRILIYMIPN